MHKISTILLVSASFLTAKTYIGGQVGASYMNPHVKIKGKDYLPNSRRNDDFTFKKSFPIKSFTFGALCGYEFQGFKVFSPFVEVDYSYSKKSKEFTTLDYHADVNALSNENLKVMQNYSVGVMPGININVNDVFSAVVGARLNVTSYTVTASHLSDRSIRAVNYKSKNALVFGIEPTLGVAYNVSKCVALRLTAGYNITRQVKAVSDYANSPEFKNYGVSASVTIRPRGFNLRAAVIFGF
jgi:hypothetical protein